MDMEELEEAVLMWAHERSLVVGGNTVAQAVKMMEEAVETLTAVQQDNVDEVADGIGDVAVTLIILAAQYGFDLQHCLDLAYRTIKSRKGKTINGMFVKEPDPMPSTGGK